MAFRKDYIGSRVVSGYFISKCLRIRQRHVHQYLIILLFKIISYIESLQLNINIFFLLFLFFIIKNQIVKCKYIVDIEDSESTESIGNNAITRASELGYIVATAANTNFSNTGMDLILVKTIIEIECKTFECGTPVYTTFD